MKVRFFTSWASSYTTLPVSLAAHPEKKDPLFMNSFFANGLDTPVSND